MSDANESKQYSGSDAGVGELENIADRAQLVLDHLPYSIFWKDRSGRVAGVNKTLLESFGVQGRDAVIGYRLADLIDGGDGFDALHESVMTSGETLTHDDLDLDLAPVPGGVLEKRRMYLRRSIVPLRDDTGHIVGVVSALQDRTELAELEARLVQAQKLESVGQLAAGIAHEINTPMQYIGDNTHFLKATVTRLLAIAEAAERASGESGTDEDLAALAKMVEKSKLPMLAERAPKAADDALSGVENVSRIVTAMKRFSHPGSDEMEQVDLNEAINTTMTVCRNEWKYSADIETSLEDNLPLIEGRLGPLNQVWLNMIVNATHAIADRHGSEKGLITITTATVDEGSAVRVTIGDNGAGISAEDLNRIFDHFFTTKEVGKGTGQGLAIAYQVITAEHNGSITVDSTPGQGTTFTLTLPITQPLMEDDDQ